MREQRDAGWNRDVVRAHFKLQRKLDRRAFRDHYWFRVCLMVFVLVVLGLCVAFAASVMQGSHVG